MVMRGGFWRLHSLSHAFSAVAISGILYSCNTSLPRDPAQEHTHAAMRQQKKEMRVENSSYRDAVFAARIDAIDPSLMHAITHEAIAERAVERQGYYNYYFDELNMTHSANHALWVAGKDSLLERLVKHLTRNARSKEEKLQALLDYVSGTVTFDTSYDHDDDELRTAYSIITDKKSDCSGKSTLFASLAMQIDPDLFLVYYKSHIQIAVPGNFPNENNTRFHIHDKQYTLVETNMVGNRYIIGMTETKNPHSFKSIEQIQRPYKNAKPYDM